MSDLPDEWRAYARLQSRLSRTHSENNRSRAVEAALDTALAAIQIGAPLALHDLERVQRSAERRERHRSRLRMVWRNDNVRNPDAQLASRDELRRIEATIGARDWHLLVHVGLGDTYDEIAVAQRGTSTALRARVLRLRRVLRAA